MFSNDNTVPPKEGNKMKCPSQATSSKFYYSGTICNRPIGIFSGGFSIIIEKPQQLAIAYIYIYIRNC